MKKLLLVLAGTMLVGMSVVNAKKLPTVAEKLPSDIKTEIVNQIDYPNLTEDMSLVGDVWIKVGLTEDSDVKIIDLSATNSKLGEYVRSKLTNLSVKGTGMSVKDTYYLKVKFDIIEYK